MDFEKKNKLQSSKTKYLMITIFMLCLIIAGGVLLYLLPSYSEKDAVNFKKAKEGDFSSLQMQMLTDSLDTYVLGGEQGFYLCINNRGNFLIKLAPEKAEEYQEYIDYFYEDLPEIPEPMKLYGMVAKPDEELKEFVMQAISQLAGEEYTAEDYEEWLDDYYLDTEYESVPGYVTVLIITGMCIAALLFLICMIRWIQTRRQLVQNDLGQYSVHYSSANTDMMFGDMTSGSTQGSTADILGSSMNLDSEIPAAQPGKEKKGSNFWLGCLGAFFGSLLGAGLWFVCGMNTRNSLYITIAVFGLTAAGFFVLCRHPKSVVKTSLVILFFSMAALFCGNYAVWAWRWHDRFGGPEFFPEALLGTGRFLTEKWYWRDFFFEYFGNALYLIICLVIVGIRAVVSGISNRRR